MRHALACVMHLSTGMNPIEARRAVRSILVAVALTALPGDRLLPRARLAHRTLVACAQVTEPPRVAPEPVPEEQEIEEPRDPAPEEQHAHVVKKAEQDANHTTPSKLREQIERCGNDPLCGLDEGAMR